MRDWADEIACEIYEGFKYSPYLDQEDLTKILSEALRSARFKGFKQAIEIAAKECDDRVSMPDSLFNESYKQGAKDCAVFIRGSLNRSYSSIMSNIIIDKCEHKNIKAGMMCDRCWDCGEFI